MSGQPTYNQSKCVEYVSSKLRESKFKVKLLDHIQPPQVHLFVFWAHETPSPQVSSDKEHTAEKQQVQKQKDPDDQRRKKVSFDALSDMDITYHAMRSSGKLGHLKHFN